MKYWIALTLCLVAMAGFVACGDDDDSTPQDTRASAIGATTESIVDSWITNGAEGLHSYLAADAAAACPVASLETALAGQPAPTAWRNTKDIAFADNTHATATVIIVADGKDVEQDWSFVLEGGDWRVSDLPGLSECGG